MKDRDLTPNEWAIFIFLAFWFLIVLAVAGLITYFYLGILGAFVTIILLIGFIIFFAWLIK